MESMQFRPDEFDAWASGYDQDVLNEGVFPFIGYKKLMQQILTAGEPLAGKRVLDVGCGTGTIAGYLAEAKAQVWSTDFSPEMIKFARKKFPQLPFEIQDVRNPLPVGYPEQYDLITSAYVFHHFPQLEKIDLIQRYMQQHLAPDGQLVIGDLVFPDRSARYQISQQYPDTWDDEYYWILEEDLPVFLENGLKVQVIPVSVCAAVLVFG